MYSLVLGDMEKRTGLEAKKQLHFLRGAASKRKSIEHGDHLTTEKDMYETADVNELLSMAVRYTLMQEYLLISM